MTPKLTGEGAKEEAVKKTTLQFLQQRVTFEPRHENKTCSACPEDQLKPF